MKPLLRISIILLLVLNLPSCNKDIPFPSSMNREIIADNHSSAAMFNEEMGNPYSIDNINKALEDLGRSEEELDPNRIWHYYQFEASTVTAEAVQILETDDDHMIQNFPFADGSIYTQEYGDDWQEILESMQDDYLYITFKVNSPVANLFTNDGTISATKLDELYLPNEDDEDLQLQVLANANNMTLGLFKITWPCLFKRPKGTIRYRDVETNSLHGVPQIKVWALVGGIPVTTLTNNNGYYEIPWLFNIGTFMGIKAANSKVKVKPINTVGGGTITPVVQVISNFLLGSTKTFGWFSSCDMKNHINVDYNNHNQERYWCHILHSIYLHQIYTAQDNIPSAPFKLTWYAHWDETPGAASAPMLGHFNINSASTSNALLSLTLGINLNSTNQNLFNQLTGLLPDITTRASNNENHANYWGSGHFSEGLMQTCFHELGHASLFTQVGPIFWGGVITNVLTVEAGCNNPNGCGYGNGTELFWGLTQVNEAWAEFIGKNHHQRLHPNGSAYVQHETLGTNWHPYPMALENVREFIESWINTGIFHDVLDPANEPWDDIQGFTIREMYECFNPTTESFCDWRDEFLQRQPSVSLTDLQLLMVVQNSWNNTCGSQWPDPVFEYHWEIEDKVLLAGTLWGR